MTFLETSLQSRARAWLVCAAALGTLPGCTATMTARTTPVRARVVHEHPVVYVRSAPVRVYESPRVYYRGRPAYLVEDRWYYPHDGGWVYFSEEPTELRDARQRRAYVRAEPRERRQEKKRRHAEPKREQRRYVERPHQNRWRRVD
jgi:hypothetical protein